MNATLPWTLYTWGQRWTFLLVLFLISTANYFDRHVLSVLLEPIKTEFRLSDTMLGLLSGFAFMTLNAVFAIPIARWADRANRRTIIALTLMVWSVMTTFCGFAQTFWHLAFARAGVGAGEAGALTPAQSLIVDYFPPGRRATPLAVFSAATVTGSLLAFGVGGYVGATYGWRTAFIVAGTPGLILALAARFILAEPRLHLGFRHGSDPTETLKESLEKLWGKRSYRYASVGFILSWFVSYGPFVFIPSFLVRVMNVALADISVTYGLVVAAASLMGTLSGGWLGDFLGERDKRWLAWLPALTSVLAGVLFVLSLSVHDFWMFMVLIFVAYALLTSSASIYAAIHSVSGSQRRATALAILLVSATLLGGGLGPLITGALSDALTPAFGPDGLRFSLMVMMTPMIATGVCYYLFGRAMLHDLED